jgi:2-polyprenyl-6-methoxyphenol hydroxylase-like FAD-dependent oxidoreductase
MKILIAGGGIGGMTLALALLDAGITDIEVFETSSSIKELGVGINVLPHATRELTELGLLDDLYATAIPTAELAYYNRHGQRIWGEPRGLAAGYNWPQFSIHRGELLGLLHRALEQRLGAERIHTGHHLSSFSQKDGRVRIELADRRTGASLGSVDGDLLVGCDGVHSVVRKAFYPAEGPPKWNGITMWRGTTVGTPFLGGRTMIMAGHFARRMVVYPISRQHELEGRSLINWVAEHKTAADQPMPVQDWEHRAEAEEAVAPFAAYTFDFLDVPAMIRGAEIIYRYPMVDRDPLPTWNFGRVTLLGDAAHPMYPVGSNGASQAIIDARILARELALQRSIEDAVAAYDTQRRPATAAVVLANRQVGPEQCMEIVEQRAPDGFTDLHAIISTEELEAISRRYKQTAGFDPRVLNERPSLSVGRAGRG